ncbi:zinc finger CCCH domain-containing protein 65-like [Asparagus officinalis]|nr:zinc finger CCCH domain-containing protein 65-like [Asparagus officinalis]
MAACDAGPVGLGLVLNPPSPVPSSDATDIPETLNADLHNLDLNTEDDPSSKSDELNNPKIEKDPEERSDELGNPKVGEDPEEKSDGADQEPTAREENGNSANENSEPSSEENLVETAVDGWGSDPGVTVPEENQKPDEVMADGWGWDQDFNLSNGNQNPEKDIEWSNGEKVEVFGWGPETGVTEKNYKPGVGFENTKEEKGQRRKPQFPVRSNEANCAYYMKMGTCKFGLNCKFNHPPNKMKNRAKVRKMPEGIQLKDAGLKENGASSENVGKTDYEKTHNEKKGGTFPDSNGQISCKYYSSPGGCKYGNACKYNHNEKNEFPAPPAALNFLGLPMRPGEKECTYYMSTGSCKYSTNCRFHHPDPTAVGGQDPSSGYQNGTLPQPHAPPAQPPMTSWPAQQNPNDQVPYTPPPYVTGFYLPPQGLHPNPEWNSYPAPARPLFTPEMNMPHPPSAATMRDTMHKGNGSAPKHAPDAEYPERPGQPECQFFMKTGTCKFKTACKFHHPKSRLPKTSGVNVSPVGLPLRPDQPICTHYNRHRICKYGLSCKYNHPMDFNPSVAPAAVPASSRKVSPVPGIEPQEVRTEGNTNSNQESEW